MLDVRRLAALDMHGYAGTRLRRTVILVEFVGGALGCLVVGLLLATRAGGAPLRLAGVWLAGVGGNYAALTFHAVSLARPGALDAELDRVDVGRELRRYTYLQLWIVVPLLFAVLAIRQHRHRPER